MKYFLHDTNSFDDEKITELFISFGYEGLGLFYTVLEKISKQEKPVKTDILKAQLKVGKRLNKCWKFMESLGLICSKNGETFNENILNFSEKYQIKKEKNRIKVSEWRERQEDKKDVTDYEPVRNRPKVNKSKVNKSKVNNTNTLHAKMRAKFESVYIDLKAVEYYWGAKDGFNLKQLISKLDKATGGDEEKILQALEIIMRKNNDKWITDNLSVAIINSKYNEIVAKIKNHSGGGYDRDEIIKLSNQK